MKKLAIAVLMAFGPFASALTAFEGTKAFFGEGNSPFELTLNADGTGTLINLFGRGSIHWAQNGEAIAVTVDPGSTFSYVAYPLVNADGEEVQVEATYTLQSLDIGSDQNDMIKATSTETLSYAEPDGDAVTATQQSTQEGYRSASSFAESAFDVHVDSQLTVPSPAPDQLLYVQLQSGGNGQVVRQDTTAEQLTSFVWNLSQDGKKLWVQFSGNKIVEYSAAITRPLSQTVIGKVINDKGVVEHLVQDNTVVSQNLPPTNLDPSILSGKSKMWLGGETSGYDIEFTPDQIMEMSAANDPEFQNLYMKWSISREGHLQLTTYRQVDADGNVGGGVMTSKADTLNCVREITKCAPMAVRDFTLIRQDGSNRLAFLRDYRAYEYTNGKSNEFTVNYFYTTMYLVK